MKDDVAAPLERWIVTPSDLALILTKHHANRLSFAVLLAFFRDQGRFPRTASEVDDLLVEEIAQQLAIAIPADFRLSLSVQDDEQRGAEIRTLLGFREATVADAELLVGWLREQAAAVGYNSRPGLVALLGTRCRELSIEPPADDRIDRIVRAAIHAHDEGFCYGVLSRLTPATRGRLEALLRPAANGSQRPAFRSVPGNGACVVAAVAQRSGEAEPAPAFRTS